MRAGSVPHSAAEKSISCATGIFSGGGSCGTKPIEPSTAVRSRRGSRPSMVTRPSKVYSPSRQRISVVLPAPLEPISATRSDKPDVEADVVEDAVLRKLLLTLENWIMADR
jgi:hypothetical protein